MKPTPLQVVTLCIWGLIGGANTSLATPPDSSCPKGFRAYEKYCIPEKDSSRPAMMMGGGCPTGYEAHGRICVLPSPPGTPTNPGALPTQPPSQPSKQPQK